MPQYILYCENNGDCYVEVQEISDNTYIFSLDENGNLYYEKKEDEEAENV